MKRWRAAAAAGFVTAALIACTRTGPDVGGVMFELTTDGTLKIDMVHVEVTNGDSKKIVIQRDFRIPQEVTLPSTIGVASNGDPRATAVFTMSAYRLDGGRRVPLDRRDHVITQVPVDRVAAVPIVLSASCSDWVKPDEASGDAVSTCGDGKTCSPWTASCTPQTLDAMTLQTYAPGDEQRVPKPAKEAGAATSACGPSQKSCAGTCVNQDDPRYGCTPAGCDACSGDPLGTFTCSVGTCKLSGCTPGYKDCGGKCVLADSAHGCKASSCEPCAGTAAGTTTCDAAGTCMLLCNNGYKLCDGKCVSLADPTYGCGETSCDKNACPNPGAGTLVCNGRTCEIGVCSSNTKNCNSFCVPSDVTHGCQETTRCTSCAVNETCEGSPSKCQCVPEAKSTTCAAVPCGIAKNNCGQDVDCGTCACSGPTSQPCGNCGTQTRTCNSGTWSAWSACTGEGACSPTTTQTCPAGGTQTCNSSCQWGSCVESVGPDTQACGKCGTQTRTCSGSTWSAWSGCTGEGLCSPAATQSCGTNGQQTCALSCQWGPCSCLGSASQPCGNCNTGTQSRTCNNGTWSTWSVCTGDGACAPNASQQCGADGTQSCDAACQWGVCTCSGPTSQACGNCGTQSRTCTNGTWSNWTPCSGEGACSPTTTQPCGGGTQTCSDTCVWGACSCGASPAPKAWALWHLPNPATAGLPNPASYTVSGSGNTVTDNVTGLVWQRNVDPGTFTWDEALQHCACLTIDGVGGWRLPSRIELVSIIDWTRTLPPIDTTAFPNTPMDAYWSSSPHINTSLNAWIVNFFFQPNTNTTGKQETYHARCVH